MQARRRPILRLRLHSVGAHAASVISQGLCHFLVVGSKGLGGKFSGCFWFCVVAKAIKVRPEFGRQNRLVDWRQPGAKSCGAVRRKFRNGRVVWWFVSVLDRRYVWGFFGVRMGVEGFTCNHRVTGF